MPDFELSNVAQQWINVILIWVGFGTLAGLLARGLVPGREPQGAVGTVVIGIVGTALGLGALSWALNRPTFNPISPLGFFAAVGGAFLLVVFYRVAALRWLVDGEERHR
ncbi:MAG: GlsB/YeaQ/YmgE family stress response membrane protein [Thermoguttaceae bacterium]